MTKFNTDAQPIEVIRNERRIVNIGIKMLSNGGIQPKNNRTWLFFILTIIRGMFLYLAYDFIKNGKTLKDLTDGCEAIFSWTQGLSKLFPIVRHRGKLNALIYDIDKFWPSCNSPRANVIFKYALMVFTIFYYIFFLSWAIYSSAPLLTHRPVFAATVPDFPYARIIIIVTQVLVFLLDLFTVTGLDFIFAAMSINVIIQFMILHIEFEELPHENSKELENNIKKCVQHHQFLLKYIATLFEVYQECLVVMYANIIFTLCVQSYALQEASTAFSAILRISYLICLFAQLSFYCFPADKISEIAINTANAVYNSKWHEFDKKNARMINFIIRRSQDEMRFEACGLVTINKAAITKIFKSALSFMALLRQLKEEQG